MNESVLFGGIWSLPGLRSLATVSLGSYGQPQYWHDKWTFPFYLVVFMTTKNGRDS